MVEIPIRRYPDHDHEGQQRTGVPRRSAARRGHMPAKGEDEQEAARVFYVTATRVTQRLVIGAGGDGGSGRRLAH